MRNKIIEKIAVLLVSMLLHGKMLQQLYTSADLAQNLLSDGLWAALYIFVRKK